MSGKLAVVVCIRHYSNCVNCSRHVTVFSLSTAMCICLLVQADTSDDVGLRVELAKFRISCVDKLSVDSLTSQTLSRSHVTMRFYVFFIFAFTRNSGDCNSFST